MHTLGLEPGVALLETGVGSNSNKPEQVVHVTVAKGG